MMRIRIDINNEPLHTIHVVNRGPIGGADGESFEPGDSEGGDGERLYEWSTKNMTGVVTHWRGDRALTLAQVVVADIINRQKLAALIEGLHP